jgi:hypothetical protein
MNRRGFLSLFGATTVAAAVPSALAELWTPSRTIFLPPTGGWIRGNQLLTVDFIVRESLRVLHQKMEFVSPIDRQYDDAFASVSHAIRVGDTVRIRMPARLSAAA